MVSGSNPSAPARGDPSGAAGDARKPPRMCDLDVVQSGGFDTPGR